MRFILSLLVCFLILGQVSFASPQIVFSDLADGYWAKSTIDYLVEKKIFSGYPDGSFRPSNNIKFNEFVVLVIKSMGLEGDSREGDNWAVPYIRKALQIGLINQNQLKYAGEDYTADLTREEMTRIVMDSIAITEGLPYPSVLNQYIKYDITDSEKIHADILGRVIDAYKLGVVSGYPDGSFKPQKIVTRAEAASVLVKVLNTNFRSPYAGNPYKDINASEVVVPVGVILDDSGKNVGVNYLFNRETTSLYVLDRSYDENGNMIRVDGNGMRQYPTQFHYVKMLAPLHKGKPINEVIDLVSYMFDNRDNGPGFLEVSVSLNSSSLYVKGFKSKDFLESVYEDETHPVIQSMVYVERIDLLAGFSPYNSYDHRYLNDGILPFNIELWKKPYQLEAYDKYSDFFISTYGEHIKVFLDILFEKDSEIIWSEMIRGLDYEGDFTEMTSNLNNRNYRLVNSGNRVSLRVSLLK